MGNMTVEHDGKTLTLKGDPYPDRVLNRRVGDTVEVINGDVYRAAATDADGNAYAVIWTDLDSNDEVADWDNYRVLPA